MSERSTREVVEDHIRCRKEGDLEGDLAANYADDVVILSAEGVHRRHAGVRAVAEVLHRYLPDGEYDIGDVYVAGEVALEHWSGRAGNRHAHDGADTFVVRDGRIVAQTIHFSVDEPLEERGPDRSPGAA